MSVNGLKEGAAAANGVAERLFHQQRRDDDVLGRQLVDQW